MYTGTPPFEKAEARDYYYKMHINNKQEAFWSSHSKKKPLGFYSPEFKALVNKLLAFDPESRPSIAQIREEAWVKGDVMMMPDLYNALLDKKRKVDAEMEEERKAKQASKGVMFTGGKFRGESASDPALDEALRSELGLDKPRLVRKLGKYDSPQFELAEATPQDFILFLARFVEQASETVTVELGDMAYEVQGSCKMAEEEMSAHLEFRLASNVEEEDRATCRVKVQVLEEGGRLFCGATREEGSSWHYSQVLASLRRAYL
jgi:hypothetical protein